MSLLLTGAGSSTNYTTAALEYFAKVNAEGGSLTTAEKGYINTFILALGSDFAEFDRLWVHGLSNSIAARISIANPSASLITAVNSPTFTANQGYAGDGTTSYLNTNFNPNTQGVKYTLNSSCIFVYSRTNSLGTFLDIGIVGAAASQSILDIRDGGNFFSGINEPATNIFSANLDSKGLFVGRRTSAIAVAQFKNGIQTKTGLNPSNQVPNFNFYIGALNNSGAASLFSARQISASGVGSGAINQTTFYTALQALGTSIGWAV